MLYKIENDQLHTICMNCLNTNVFDVSAGSYLAEFHNYRAPECACGATELFILNRTDEPDPEDPGYTQLQCLLQLRVILEEGN